MIRKFNFSFSQVSLQEPGFFFRSHFTVFGWYDRTQNPQYSKSTVLKIRCTQKPQYSKSAVLKNRITQKPHYSKSALLKIRITQKPQYKKTAVLKIHSNQKPQYSKIRTFEIFASFTPSSITSTEFWFSFSFLKPQKSKNVFAVKKISKQKIEIIYIF